MSYELNAKITLPPFMNSSQICELNIGRYNSSIAAYDEKNACEKYQPQIVSYVIHALATHFEEEDGSEVTLTVEYFVRAV